MTPPILVSMVKTPAALHELPETLREASQAVFQVQQAGWFGGRRWREGMLLVCGPMSRGDHQVVLVPRGMGRPRLGTVEQGALFGDCSEPCSALRWHPAGAIIAVVEPTRRQTPSGVPLHAVIAAPVPRQTISGPQLQLFAA